MDTQIKQKKRSKLEVFARRISKNKLATVGFFVIIFLVLVAIFAPFIAPYDYTTQDFNSAFAPPSKDHLLGADNLGRDVLSRLIYGTRQSLRIGVLSVGLALCLGGVIGAIAGYYGGRVDNILMRMLDIYQSIPALLLSIAFAASLGPGIDNAIIAIGIATISDKARLLRASIMTVRDKEFVEAAVAINAKDSRIIWRHVVPNAIAPLIVTTTMNIGHSILAAATLSFIGLGAQPPLPEWGAMLSAGRSYMRDSGFLVIFPGIAIMISVLSFNLFGDGLRDALDPRLKN